MPRYKGYGKSTTDDYLEISIVRLNQWGYLKQGQYQSGSMTWSSDGIPHSSMRLLVNSSNTSVTLSFRVNKQDDYKYDIRLQSTPCNFGGKRYWFTCMKCHSKRGCLYLASNNLFYCRVCLDLTYESNLVSKRYRLYDKLFSHDLIDEKNY